MKRALRLFDGAFFQPGDLRDLAVVRIVLSAAFLTVLRPSLSEQLRLATEGSPTAFKPIPALKVLLLPLGEWGLRPEPMLLHGVWLISILAGCLVLIGLWTRPAAFALAGTYTLLIAHNYSFGEFHHPQAPYAIALWILAFSKSGATLSADRLRFRVRMAAECGVFQAEEARERMSPEGTWPLKAIQWVLALCYTSAGLFKWARGGFSWLNGHTLSYYLIMDGVRWGNPLAITLAGLRPVVVVMSVFTLVFELTFSLAVIVPPAAILYLTAGVALHAGIDFLMNAAFPHWMVLYVAFLPSLRGSWRRLRARVWSPARERSQRVVVYDGTCRVCLATMAILDELDLASRLHMVDGRSHRDSLPSTLQEEDVMHQMHVLEEDGTVRRGFDAFRSVVRVIPLLWPVLLVMSAPGAGIVGPRVYAVVANRRRCATGACRLDGHAATGHPTGPATTSLT